MRTREKMHRSTPAVVLACVAAFACTTGTKQEVAKTALTSMSVEDRHESFEATARVLDEHPELVDEFYAITKQHPRTLGRFMANTARDLREPELATMTGDLLTQHPDSLEQTLARTTDFIVERKDARTAMSKAIASRAPQTVDVLTDDPDALSRVLAASLGALETKPRARTAALAAVRQNRGRIIALVKNDKKLAKEMTEELLREIVEDKPALEKLLRAANIIDEPKK